jgi:hypothetical protein
MLDELVRRRPTDMDEFRASIPLELRQATDPTQVSKSSMRTSLRCSHGSAEAVARFRLLGGDGQIHDSATPGALGGNKAEPTAPRILGGENG